MQCNVLQAAEFALWTSGGAAHCSGFGGARCQGPCKVESKVEGDQPKLFVQKSISEQASGFKYARLDRQWQKFHLSGEMMNIISRIWTTFLTILAFNIIIHLLRFVHVVQWLKLLVCSSLRTAFMCAGLPASLFTSSYLPCTSQMRSRHLVLLGKWNFLLHI